MLIISSSIVKPRIAFWNSTSPYDTSDYLVFDYTYGSTYYVSFNLTNGIRATVTKPHAVNDNYTVVGTTVCSP